MSNGEEREVGRVDAALKPRIWIVEDSATARRHLERVLGDRFQVAAFADGPSMIERLGLEPSPHLVLLDVEMPIMSGLDVCQFLRSRLDEIDLPVLMVTANTERATAREALAAGANDIVRRPFETEELLARIRNLLMLGKLAEQRVNSLRAMFAQVPAVVAHMRGPEHIYDLANAAYLAIVGHRQVLGQPFRDALPELADTPIVAMMDRVYATGEPFFADEMAMSIDRDGTGVAAEAFFNFTYQPTRGASGEIDGIFVHAVEVTDNVRARQRAQLASDELARSERWLSTLLISIGDAVISTDRDLRITFANAIAETLTGWPAAEMKGVPLPEVFHLVHALTREIVANPAEAALREGRVVGLANHTVLVQRDGTEILIDDSASPIRDLDGTVTGAVLVFRDVRHRAQAEHDRRQYTREVELTATVSLALAGPDALDRQLQRCAEAIVGHLDAASARIWTVTGEHGALELRASAGQYAQLDGRRAGTSSGALKLERVLAERRPHVTNDVANDPEIGDPAWARRENIQAFAGMPIVVENRMVGVLGVFSRRAVSDTTLRSLTSVANQLAVGIERFNVTVERERLHRQSEVARQAAESQRAQLSALFAQAPVAIAMMRGPSYLIELANPHVCALWGRSEHELLGKPLFEALPEIAGQGLEELLAGVVTSGVAYVGTELLVRVARGPGGALEDVYFNFVYEPMRDAAGAVEAVLVVAIDVTESVRIRRKVEELAAALREREERLRLALEASEAGAWEVDLRTRIVEADPFVRKLFHLRADQEFSAELGLATIHAEDSKRVARNVQRVLKGRNHGAFHEQFRIVGEDGTATWIDSRGHALFDATGTAHRFLGTMLDITERKQTEALREALFDSERRAREVSERQRDFEQYLVGIVSHDLRNPLQTIIVGTEILLGTEALDAAAAKSLVRIRNSADRATRMIRDVLDFTQVRLGGGLTLYPVDVDLAELVREMRDELRLSEPLRELVVTIRGDTRGRWDADRLTQVLSNLVTNALKYSPQGTPVDVTVHGTADEIELTVHNIGSVIPAAQIPQLFLPMHRSVLDTRNVQRSVGLGLYIVEHIVTLHGGHVAVTSTIEEGTTFRVVLPKQPARDCSIS